MKPGAEQPWPARARLREHRCWQPEGSEKRSFLGVAALRQAGGSLLPRRRPPRLTPFWGEGITPQGGGYIPAREGPNPMC